MSNLNTRKSCVVPKCKNTTTDSPSKLFFSVPMDVKMRMKWAKAMKRYPFGSKSNLYCCEDHFDIEDDQLVGGGIKLKKGIVPHKFKCQEVTNEKSEKPEVQKQTLKAMNIRKSYSYFRSRQNWTDYEKEIIEFVRKNPIIYDPDIEIIDDIQRERLIKIAWKRFAYQKRLTMSRRRQYYARKLRKRWKLIISDYYSDKHKTQKFFDGSLSFLPKKPTFAHSAGTVSVYTDDKVLFNNDKKEETVSVYTSEVPNYSFSGSRLSQNDKNVNVSHKIASEPSVSNSSKDVSPKDTNKTDKPKFDREMLLQATVLTQDMIEELLRIKSNEGDPDDNNILAVPGHKNTKIVDTILKKECKKNPYSNGNASKIPSSSSVFNIIADAINTDDQNINISTRKTIYLHENEKNTSRLHHQKVQDYMDYQKSTTIKSFVQMGEHILVNFPENEHEKLRTMISSLILQEESALID